MPTYKNECHLDDANSKLSVFIACAKMLHMSSKWCTLNIRSKNRDWVKKNETDVFIVTHFSENSI